MRADELAHHPKAFGIVENDETCSVLQEKVLSALEVTILANHDAGDTI